MTDTRTIGLTAASIDSLYPWARLAAAVEVGTRLGIVLMMTLIGTALGGWLSRAIFDLFGPTGPPS